MANLVGQQFGNLPAQLTPLIWCNTLIGPYTALMLVCLERIHTPEAPPR